MSTIQNKSSGNRFLTGILRLGALATVLFLVLIQLLQASRSPSYGAWGILHYYLGSKYSKELGYFNLYNCLVQTNVLKLPPNTRVRNLSTYQLVPIRTRPPCPRYNFTPMRWRAFVADTDFITRHAPIAYWEEALTDKGFNPPPSWAAIAGLIAQNLPLNTFTYFLINNFDMCFVLAAAVVVWYTSGLNIALLTALLSFLYFGTFLQISNNFLQFAWYPCLTAAIAFWKKALPVRSGLFLGIASGLQAFPIFFALPFCAVFLFSLVKKQKLLMRQTFLFLLAFGITILFFFSIGSLYNGSPRIWQQWYAKISLHRSYINGELFSIGFVNLVGIIFAPDHANSSTYQQDYPHTQIRDVFLYQHMFPLLLCTVCLLPIILSPLWRLRQTNPFIIGYFFIYFFLTLSPVYYLILALLPYCVWQERDTLRNFVTASFLSLFIVHLLLFWHVSYINFIYPLQLFSKLTLFTFFVILLCLLIFKKQQIANPKSG